MKLDEAIAAANAKGAESGRPLGEFEYAEPIGDVWALRFHDASDDRRSWYFLVTDEEIAGPIRGTKITRRRGWLADQLGLVGCAAVAFLILLGFALLLTWFS